MRKTIGILSLALLVALPMLLASCSGGDKVDEGASSAPAPKADDDRGAAGRGRGEGAGGK